MPKMTKYTAEWMLAQVKAKVDSTDPTLEALRLVPIPELKEDLSNYDHWYHTVGFHLEYYGLIELVKYMKNQYPEGPLREDFKTAADWQRWQRHCLHAYSIIYSRATKVIEQGFMFLRGFNGMSHYCPQELISMIQKYKEYKIPYDDVEEKRKEEIIYQMEYLKRKI